MARKKSLDGDLKEKKPRRKKRIVANTAPPEKKKAKKKSVSSRVTLKKTSATLTSPRKKKSSDSDTPGTVARKQSGAVVNVGLRYCGGGVDLPLSAPPSLARYEGKELLFVPVDSKALEPVASVNDLAIIDPNWGGDVKKLDWDDIVCAQMPDRGFFFCRAFYHHREEKVILRAVDRRKASAPLVVSAQKGLATIIGRFIGVIKLT